MIEVNLLPGGKKGSAGGFSFNFDAIKNLGRRSGGGGGGGGVDPYQGFFAVAAALAIGYMGFSFMSLRSQAEELNVQLEAAVQDSVRNAAIIQRTPFRNASRSFRRSTPAGTGGRISSMRSARPSRTTPGFARSSTRVTAPSSCA